MSPGASQTVTITPDNCHRLVDVRVDGVSRGPITSYTFTNVDSDHMLEARFAALGPYTVTASATTGGTISPPGSSSFACGSNPRYVIAPSDLEWKERSTQSKTKTQYRMFGLRTALGRDDFADIALDERTRLHGKLVFENERVRIYEIATSSDG